MTSHKIEFHEEAAAEFEAAIEWYFSRSELAAARFASEVNHALELIAKAPDRWAVGVAGARKYPLRRFPFSIVYRQLPLIVQVLAVAHGHRRPGYWKGRYRRVAFVRAKSYLGEITATLSTPLQAM